MQSIENIGEESEGVALTQQGLMRFMYEGVDQSAPAAALVVQTLKNATAGRDAVHGLTLVFRAPALMPKARVEEIAKSLYEKLVDLVETTPILPHIDPSSN